VCNLRIVEEILASNFWWNIVVHPCEKGFPKKQEAEICVQGWDSIAAIWFKDESRFISPLKIREKFNLSLEKWHMHKLSSNLRDYGGGRGVLITHNKCC